MEQKGCVRSTKGRTFVSGGFWDEELPLSSHNL